MRLTLLLACAILFFGSLAPDPEKVDWETLVNGVQDHIKGLNWGYRVALRDKGATYLNAFGTLVDAHTVKTVNKRGVENLIKAKYIVLAPGGKLSTRFNLHSC